MLRLTLAILLLTTACTPVPKPEGSIAPHVAGPFVGLAAGKATVSEAATDEALLARWWRLYDDPGLNTVIEEALAANTDLRVARANLSAARAVLSEARGRRGPATTASGGATYGEGPANGQAAANDAGWSYDAGLTVAWEADLFGRLRGSAEAARLDAEAAAADAEATQVLVVAEATRAYLDACAYAELVEVARSSLTLAEDSLRLVETRRRAGAASRLDVEQAAAIAAEARAVVPPLVGQRRTALFELAALLGRQPADILQSMANCTGLPDIRAALPVGDGAGLLRRRPDVRAAERRMAADATRIGVATADLYPTISLGGTVGYADINGGGDGFAFSLGPLISWNFPNVSVARARVRQAEARAQASLAAFDGTVLTALKEVEQVLATLQGQNERAAALAEASSRSEQAFRLAEARYKSGSIAYLDVLVAQRAYMDVRLAEAETHRQLASLQVDLFKALGGGWGQAAPVAPSPYAEPNGAEPAQAMSAERS